MMDTALRGTTRQGMEESDIDKSEKMLNTYIIDIF